VRWVFLILTLLAGTAVAAAPEGVKKPAAKKQLAHKKATPEQIRKFNALQKKKQDPKRKQQDPKR
jgi:hypothetical protein